MKIKWAVTFIFVFIIHYAKAQESTLKRGMGFGVQVNQYQRDFGIGVNANSPYFIHDKVGVRLRANLMYHQHLKDESVTWSPYFNVSAGLIGIAGYVGDYIKLYGEGGVIGLFPSSEFSSEDFVFGGYGLFGFEFYMNNSSNYFIEIGGVGTGATADKVPTNPIYSNGLLISVGFRGTLN